MNDSLYELEQLTEEEVRGYEIYRRKYIMLYPPPIKPSPVKQGWEFKAYLIVSIAAVLLASMRTAEQFYRAATFSANPVLGYIEAFLAVFTVETGIVVYAAVLAARQKKIASWVMWIGIVLLAAISIVAGLGQSLYLTSNVDPNFLKYTEYMLSILIGPGASIAALIGGHILGQQIAQAAQLYEQLMAEYENEMQQYNDKLMRAWLRSVERKVALGMMALPRPELQEAEYSGEVQHAELQPLLLEKNPVQPAKSAELPASIPMGFGGDGNHRQRVVQQQQKPTRQPIAPPQPQLNDAAITRMITQWLIKKGKTPFDADITPASIATDTQLDERTVANILARMRNAKPI